MRICSAKVVSISFLYSMDSTVNKNEIFTVGLTGGIGSGKSTAAKVFKALGVPVFCADKAGHTIYVENSKIRNSVIEKFGVEVAMCDSDGKAVDIDRQALGKLAFSEEGGIEFLNDLVHPAVENSFQTWVKNLPSTVSYVILEAAILFESGASKGCDAVITVSAEEAQRIARVKHRDGYDIAVIEGKIKAQTTDLERESHSDFILRNNDSDKLLPQIEKLNLVLKGKSINFSK
ncbi:MAG: dephospho-CoA kinase [Flavobacteriales bacterium]|jgi:dephospho-CoA kinase|nr:dephospho-CoA kinase [Flavobacteriales bacterium]